MTVSVTLDFKPSFLDCRATYQGKLVQGCDKLSQGKLNWGSIGIPMSINFSSFKSFVGVMKKNCFEGNDLF